MRYTFRHWSIPDRMMGAITRYLEQGIPPGDFLTAVIDNDFQGAIGRADEENMANLPAYAAYFSNEAPSPCWGSPAKRRAWLEAKDAERATAEAAKEEA